ncbi:MAG TPA: division plane positioning ATPase MipZ [Kiloniellales bacterium]|nr:division plane positioning ATPase MipZ [Kiloniellales bacterium]
MNLLGRLTEPLRAGGGRACRKPFLEAAIAGAALAATADGPVSFARRHTLDQALASVEALRVFDVHEAVDLFDALAGDLLADTDGGEARAYERLAKVRSDRETARTVLRIAEALAKAGPVDPPTQARVGEIATRLGLEPPRFDQGPPVVKPRADETERPRVVVVGNQKGGTGKSTTAIHLIVALLRAGRRVGSLDLDAGQGTLSRYLANREAFVKREAIIPALPLPLHRRIADSTARDRDEAEREETAKLTEALAALADREILVVDTPGGRSFLGRLALAQADVLTTPFNDSFLDIDVLAEIDRERREVRGPSPFGRLVLDEAERRATDGRPPLDWIVMRNRLAHIDARNTREMTALLRRLAERMGFRLEPGLSERVAYRELFYRGLMLLDLPEPPPGTPGAASHSHARREIRDLVEALDWPAATAAEPAPLAASQ